MCPDENKSQWLDYLRWFTAGLAATVLFSALLNFSVDPLGVFDTPRIAGFNARKPYLDHHREFSRFHAAQRMCADVGIFGNSRAEIGFDPLSSAFAAHGMHVFNHAIAGTSISTTQRQLTWLDAVGCRPHTLVLGVEFFDFVGSQAAALSPITNSDKVPHLDSQFLAETMFSVSGVRDALATIGLQRAAYPAVITDQGFNPLLNYIPEVAHSGYYDFFRQRAQENLRNWSRKPHTIRPDGAASSDEPLLANILDTSAHRADTVYLVIYPYHAEVRLMMERLGLGPLFAEWKRLIVAMAEQGSANGAHVEVWDFSALSPETSEAIPAHGDRKTQLEYYWEGGHFKKALGDRVIARILGQPAKFGVRLQHDNLDAYLRADQRQITELAAEPSPLRDEVDSLFRAPAAK